MEELASPIIHLTRLQSAQNQLDQNSRAVQKLPQYLSELADDCSTDVNLKTISDGRFRGFPGLASCVQVCTVHTQLATQSKLSGKLILDSPEKKPLSKAWRQLRKIAIGFKWAVTVAWTIVWIVIASPLL